ncbi:MAG TPA: GNVR domain-containing protein [Candidatus Limnocylindrales bacterium]|nr:GNVR domain-containing protein [Candidatus Limnocylindrales bacterium]
MTRASRGVVGSLIQSASGDFWRLLAVVGVAAVLAGAAVKLYPADYVADASILLDAQGEGTSLVNLAQISDLLPQGALQSQSRKENGYAYMAISQSRAVLTHLLGQPQSAEPTRPIMERFAPHNVSPSRSLEIAVRRLRKRISSRFDPRSGLYEILVKHRDPILAADIANKLIEELKRFNSEVRSSRAKGAVVFVEARLDDARNALSLAEDRLTAFNAANARIGNAPELLLQQKRLERNVKLSEDIYALLAKQVELARIQEKKESPVFSVVDPAVPPTRPQRFSLALAVLLGGLMAGFAYLLLRSGVVVLRS